MRKKLALSWNKTGGLLRVGAQGGVGRSSPRTLHSFLLGLSFPPWNPGRCRQTRWHMFNTVFNYS